MATTAPAVTSAVDSHSTPMISHTGRGLRAAGSSGLDQDLKLRLRLAQGRGR